MALQGPLPSVISQGWHLESFGAVMSREAYLGRNPLPGPCVGFGILGSGLCIFTDIPLGTESSVPRGSTLFLAHQDLPNLVPLSSRDLRMEAARTKCSHAIKSTQTWLRQVGATFQVAPGVLNDTPKHFFLYSFCPQPGSLIGLQATCTSDSSSAFRRRLRRG